MLSCEIDYVIFRCNCYFRKYLRILFLLLNHLCCRIEHCRLYRLIGTHSCRCKGNIVYIVLYRLLFLFRYFIYFWLLDLIQFIFLGIGLLFNFRFIQKALIYFSKFDCVHVEWRLLWIDHLPIVDWFCTCAWTRPLMVLYNRFFQNQSLSHMEDSSICASELYLVYLIWWEELVEGVFLSFWFISRHAGAFANFISHCNWMIIN